MDANPKQTTKDRLGLIYAWNEMGEGGWLVQCRDDPDGPLAESHPTRRARQIETLPSRPNAPPSSTEEAQ